MTSAISMISCGENIISPQSLKVSDIESIQSEQLLSEVFYECKRDILAKDAIESPLSDVLDIKIPVLGTVENPIAENRLFTAGSFPKSVSSECLSSMDWMNGSSVRPDFLDFHGMDLVDVYGDVYGMRRSFSEGDIKTLGNGHVSLIHSPRGLPQIFSNCATEDRKKKLSRYRNKKSKRNFGRKIKDYAWVKSGMIFRFIDNVDRFQGQTDLNDSKPSDLRSAIEEAFLAEQGFTEMLMVEINVAAGNLDYLESIRGGVLETTDSNQEQECNTHKQNVFIKKEEWSCEGCGSSLLHKTYNEMKASIPGCRLCDSCARLKKNKHSCGICKKIRNHLDTGSWVRCGSCKVWVHAACDKMSCNFSKDLGAADYYCPECRAKFNFELSDSEDSQPKVKSNKKNVLPDKVTVVCSGVEGIYFPSLHLVICKCGYCGTEKQALSEWERHTGSKSKNWKTSVRVKDSMLPLEQWMLQIAEYHTRTAVSVNSLKRPSMKVRKQKLLNFLKEKYEPVCAKWTTERCAVCRWVEDWDYNKIIICNRCQIAVHQECYGARNVKDFTSWVCRACETPNIKRECCLCPVKGMFLD